MLPLPNELGAPAKFRRWRPHQAEAVLDAASADTRFLVMTQPTGSGKCHPAGTRVLMRDGTSRAVEDLTAGDVLLGPDGAGRKILSTSKGYGEIVEIRPRKGDPWRCNLDHILVLERTRENHARPDHDGEQIEISVRDWLGRSRWFRHVHKMIRAGCIESFGRSDYGGALSPYMVGILLGDGSLSQKKCVAVTSGDPEVEAAVYEEARRFGADVREQSGQGCTTYHFVVGGNRYKANPVLDACRELDLMGKRAGDKVIPPALLYGDVETRQQVLAGLVDADGSLANGIIDYVSLSQDLAVGVAFLARSLGLQATVRFTPSFYWRVCVSGDLTQIPTRIARKRPEPRRQKKSVLRTGFDVVPVGPDDYYGFTLEGDGRYLLADFTVTHNTLTYITLRALLDMPRTGILTSTKALQQQLRTEFQSLGLADVRGANSYPCRALMKNGEFAQFRDASRWSGSEHAPVRWQGCDEGPCHHGLDCSLRHRGCDYYDAVRTALTAPIVSTNYAYWLNRHAHVPDPGLGQFGLLVCDEAHNADEQLANFLTVRLTAEEIDLSGSTPPDDPKFAKEWGGRAEAHVSKLVKRIENEGLTSGPAIRHLHRLKNLAMKLERLSSFDHESWVWTREGRRIRYGPVLLAGVAEKYLYLDIPKVILTSATVTKRTAVSIGAPEDDLTVFEYPSPFPVANRTVNVVGTIRMRHRMTAGELGVWMSRIDHIIGQRLDRKGIIHTTSYERMSWIAQNSEHRDKMITHTSFDLRRAIARFRNPRAAVGPRVAVRDHGLRLPGRRVPLRHHRQGAVPLR